MILAAGRGERMRPLTDLTPKPLIEVGGQPLISRHLERLKQAGVDEVIINTAWLGEQIEEYVSDGHPWGVKVVYSREAKGALETGGGILKAMPLLGNQPFWLVNGDIWTDFPFARLPERPSDCAHLVLVDNPPHNEKGDFALANGRVHTSGAQMLTFAGIAALKPNLWSGYRPGNFPLAPLLRRAAELGRVSGDYWPGAWHDIGTPERLQAARQAI
ncbi:glucose-1-phosphate thymidylyltransferase [Halorhodospira halochloris]|uniref:Glucose-1-phosphate thymidylyltransferase n=2 Tax=Halorhodospira halochloris TaxID=1052 RepID=A0A0X8X6F3_HALHR|nr:glucose-1-phosphate thymidylyltransferase [Halorhodospira halochloris]